MRSSPRLWHLLPRLLWLSGVVGLLLGLAWWVPAPFEPTPLPAIAGCGQAGAQCQRIDKARLVATGQALTLPHANLQPDGRTQRYEIDLQVPPSDAGQGLGLCMPRSGLLRGLAIDGEAVPVRVYQPQHTFLRPLHLQLDQDLAPGAHVITLEVGAPPGLSPGLGQLWAGRDDLMSQTCASLYMSVRDRAHNITWVMAAIGLAALLLWARSRDRQALTFACITLGWVLHLWVVGAPQDLMGDSVWSLLFFSSRVLFVPPMLLYGLQLCGFGEWRGRPWVVGAVLVAYALALAALPWVPGAQVQTWLLLVGSVSMALTCGLLVFLVRGLWRSPSLPRALTVLGFCILVLAHGVDLQRWSILAGYDTRAWSYLAVPVLCVVFGARLVQDLMAHATRHAQDAERLRQEVEAQRTRIAADYERLQRQREELAVLQERRRIVRDMHDGLGAQLLSASARLKSPEPFEMADIAGFFDEALEELRSVLDVLSVEPSQGPEDDPVSALLGTLRWRIAPALAAKGIELQWRCDALPADFLAGDAERMHLLRFWQEAFSNVLKHSQARVVRFAATARQGRVEMHLVDDGRGFEVEGQPGIGLGSMRARSGAIGARFHLRSVPGRGAELSLAWEENHLAPAGEGHSAQEAAKFSA